MDALVEEFLDTEAVAAFEAVEGGEVGVEFGDEGGGVGGVGALLGDGDGHGVHSVGVEGRGWRRWRMGGRGGRDMGRRLGCFIVVVCVVGTAGVVRGQGAEGFGSVEGAGLRWMHLSSRNGDLPRPGESAQQTGAVVGDLDGDGVNDFVLSFREKGAALVWYRRGQTVWERYVIEKAFLHRGGGWGDF